MEHAHQQPAGRGDQLTSGPARTAQGHRDHRTLKGSPVRTLLRRSSIHPTIYVQAFPRLFYYALWFLVVYIIIIIIKHHDVNNFMKLNAKY